MICSCIWGGEVVFLPALCETMQAGLLFPAGEIFLQGISFAQGGTSAEGRPLDPFALRTTMLLGLYCCFIASKIALSYRNVTQSGQNVTRFDGGAVGRVVE